MARSTEEGPAASVVNGLLSFLWNTSTLNLVLFSLAVAVLLLLVLPLLRRNSRSRGNSLLLLGIPDAGKTAIFSTLSYKQTLPSHMSLQTNSAFVTLSPSQALRIIDIPGHPRIRGQFQEYFTDAKVIAFVVDASTISRNGQAVAEHLHHILHAITSLPPSHPTPKLVVLCHKTDLIKMGASSSSVAEVAIQRVRAILERELEKRKASKLGGVEIESMDAEGEILEMGGLECNGPAGNMFKFSEWEGGEICFLATWVKVSEAKVMEKRNHEDGLSNLIDWLQELSG